MNVKIRLGDTNMQNPDPHTPQMVRLEAEPEQLDIDLRRTAVVVIDMTNAFIRKGGFFDLLGVDISLCEKAIEPVKRISDTARSKGCKIIHIVHRIEKDLSDAGGEGSVNRAKDATLRIARERPESIDKLYFRNTWGSEIVDELEPHKDDIVIEKPRYSAFAGTDLDMTLRGHDIKYVVFVGIATNGCVEASIRDAFNLEYWPVLIPDACASNGPPFTREATIWIVKLCLGWVIGSEAFVEALK